MSVLPIPLHAMAVVNARTAYPLLDLYSMGHTAGGPFPANLKGLALRWSTTRGSAREVLLQFQAAGLIDFTVDRNGKRATGYTISIPAQPGVTPVSAPVKQAAPVRQKVEKSDAPGWAVKARRPGGVTASALSDAVCSILHDVTGSEINPARAGTGAKEVLKVWRALEYPDLDSLVMDFRALSEAARSCPDPLFARDIRAEGWADGRDRSRDISTLCVLRKWEDRQRVARLWKQQAARRDEVVEPVDDGPMPSLFT